MKYTINKEEILEYMHNVHSSTILDLLETLRNHCYENDIPLLNNPSINMESDFVELILDCLDINLIFSEKNKLN